MELEKKKFTSWKLEDMEMKPKLMALFMLVGIIPLAIASWIGYNKAHTALEVANTTAEKALKQQVFNQLIAIRELKRVSIERYFQQIHDQIITFSENKMVVNAMQQFRKTFANFRKENNFSKKELENMRKKLLSYYTEDFSVEYQNKNRGKLPPVRNYFQQLDDDSIAFQYTYIKANKFPLGSKHLLNRASDPSEYSTIHKQVHPIIRSYLEKFGYYDIFLVDPNSGDIVYSVFKELDYSTSLLNGPFSRTNFGEAFRKANLVADKKPVIVDFKQYAPSYEAPASFIAIPIFHGENKIGIAMFQMPLDRISSIMSNRSGLGKTGETYLVGSDLLMRSDSFRDKQNRTVDASFRNPLQGKVDTDASRAATTGSKGEKIITSYDGEKVLSAYTPVQIGNFTWGLQAEIAENEAYAVVKELRSNASRAKTELLTLTSIVVGLAIIGIILMALSVASKISDPLGKTVEVLKSVAEGNLDHRLDIESKDEIGQMAKSLNQAIQNIKEQTEEQGKLVSIIENTPSNIMYADLDLNIQYINPASKKTLRKLQQYLPVNVDNIVGQSIDVFHKNPGHQRNFLADDSKLPHRTFVNIGPEKLELIISGLYNQNKEFTGTMVTWEIVTEVDEILQCVSAAAKGDLTREIAINSNNTLGMIAKELTSLFQNLRKSMNNIGLAAVKLSESAQNLSLSSEEMTSIADNNSSQVNTVSSSIEHINKSTQMVAAAIEQTTATIVEISSNAAQAAYVANSAVGMANKTNNIINKLGNNSGEIGNVVSFITSIAEQTNLLALNATIEAARAGELGKGFAVVANEVKELAKQTTSSTKDVRNKIEGIQGGTSESIEAINQISKIIHQINEFQTSISAAVEEQSATSGEIKKNIDEAAMGVNEITENISMVVSAAEQTSQNAQKVQDVARELGIMAGELQIQVEQFQY